MTPNYTPKTLRFAPIFLLFLTISLHTKAQNLPKAWRFSPDGHRMIIGNKLPTSGLYDSTKIRNYYLTFAQTNYWALLTSGYTAHTDVLANLMVDSVAYDSVGVRFKGMTSYSQVPGQKKLFNIFKFY